MPPQVWGDWRQASQFLSITDIYSAKMPVRRPSNARIHACDVHKQNKCEWLFDSAMLHASVMSLRLGDQILFIAPTRDFVCASFR
jgi:hypothetical protein